MTTREQNSRYGALRRWVAHLLLVTFVARALVPVGYMPDFSAAAKGVFKIVICSASGSKTLTMNADGTSKPDTKHQSVTHDQPCAFAAVAAVAQPNELSVDFVPANVIVHDYRARIAAELPPARAGPAHGSRAPPQIS